MTPNTDKNLDSKELGTLFERAVIPILTELFVCWGYENIESYQQKTGTQHGFDILFKMSRNNIPLYIFVECKASKEYNEIDVYELKKKIDQFDWAGYPHKDIHLFLSMTRSVRFTNEFNSIEDNSLPFIVIDWMRKQDTIHPAAELFFTYAGDCADVFQYREELRKAVKEMPGKKPFRGVAEGLRQAFETRISDYYAVEYRQDCQFISGAFWERVIDSTKEKHLNLYYIKTDSRNSRLQEVVASASYIRNSKIEEKFEEILSQTANIDNSLIEILSRGGEGKSTFMHHIAKHYYRDYNIFYLYNFDDEILELVRAALQRLNNRLPVMLLLDDASAYGDCLSQLINRLDLGFRKYKLIFVAAERNIRYNHIENLDRFKDIFDEVYTIEFITTPGIRKQIFDRLFSELNVGNALTGDKQEELRRIYLQDKRRSTTENTFAVLKNLTEKEKIQIKFTFDWEDWDKFARGEYSQLKKLYLLLATFYQFGFSLDLEFCAGLLEVETNDIINAMDANRNLPIHKRGKKLYLRHETIADWFLNHKKKNRKMSENIFKRFLNHVNKPFSRTLFIRLYKNKEFMKSYLGGYMTEEKRIEILSNFIENNPGELNCRTELSKIYQQQKRWREAENILNELKDIDPENLPARTELSKIYQQQQKWAQAESILLECIDIQKDDLNSRTELSKLYQNQNKWKKVEDILQECLEIKNNDVNSMLELGKLYIKKNRGEEAEKYFKQIIEIDPDNLHARTELSFIYFKKRQFRNREQILFEIYQLNPGDSYNLAALSKMFSRFKKYRIALKLLKLILSGKDDDLFAVIMVIDIYKLLKDIRNASLFYQKGKSILSRDQYNKYKEKFLQ